MPEAVPADVVAAAAAESYDELPGRLTGELLRQGFNDHYVLTDDDGRRWIGRVYLGGKYYAPGPDDWRAELDLLVHLAERDVPVSTPLPRDDGERLGPIGDRWMAVFPYAPGDLAAAKVDDPDVARALGAAAGAIHSAADAIGRPLHRYTFDTRYLVDEPVRLVEELLARHGRGDLSEWKPRIDELRATAESLGRGDVVFGLIHGDLHGRNAHVSDDGEITVFDFDHCGYGWRAFDMATSSMVIGDLWDDWLAGYRNWRDPSDEELATLPTFRNLRILWDQGDVLAMRPAWGRPVDDEKDAEACDRVLAGAAELLGGS